MNRRNTAVKRAIVLAISVLLALIVALPMAFAQGGQGAKATDKVAELSVDWWKWALSKPVEVNPQIGSYKGGPKCNGKPVSPTPGNTWFLAGSNTGEKVKRTCTVPFGTKLFFPVVNAVAFPFAEGETRHNQRQLVKQFIREVVNDPDFSMSVTVDGKEVKSNRIVRALSPVFSVTLPKDNIFGIPAGKYDDASSNGLWVTLPPLSKGKHKIHFEMSAPNVDLDPTKPGNEGFFQNNTYLLKVVNENKNGGGDDH
jgi:hypothetical protein